MPKSLCSVSAGVPVSCPLLLVSWFLAFGSLALFLPVLYCSLRVVARDWNSMPFYVFFVLDISLHIT